MGSSDQEQARDAYGAGTGALVCSVCGAEFPVGGMFHGCPSCGPSGAGSPLEYRAKIDAVSPAVFARPVAEGGTRGVWRYSELLPPVRAAVSLGEGGTPLVALPELGDQLGVQLYLKNETCNPTWSFKDRYVSVAVSVARELGYTKVLCLSAGNFGHSASAYCARAGMECRVLCVPGASTMMRQAMQIHGATVVTMPDGSEKTGLVRRLVDDEGWFPMTCLDPASASQIANPFGPAGYKTIWYEVVSELGRVPDTVFVPVGGGDCLTGIWRGALEWRELGLASTVPRLVGCQSSAAAPLVEAVRDGTGEIREVAELPTRALSIRHGRCSPTALEAVRDSGGGAVAISDRELLDAIKLVARCGLLPEAASATTIAAAVKMVGSGEHVGGTVVCVVTGSAAKWSDLMEELAGVEGGAAVRNEGEGRGRNRQAQRMTRLGAVHD